MKSYPLLYSLRKNSLQRSTGPDSGIIKYL
jgi:hypothetical protein